MILGLHDEIRTENQSRRGGRSVVAGRRGGVADRRQFRPVAVPENGGPAGRVAERDLPVSGVQRRVHAVVDRAAEATKAAAHRGPRRPLREHQTLRHTRLRSHRLRQSRCVHDAARTKKKAKQNGNDSIGFVNRKITSLDLT